MSDSEVAICDLIVLYVILNNFVICMFDSFAVFEDTDAQNLLKTVNSSIFSVITGVEKMITFDGFLLIAHHLQKK